MDAKDASVIGGQIATQEAVFCIHLPSLMYLSDLPIVGFKKYVFNLFMS
jgi:hypothetical protein